MVQTMADALLREPHSIDAERTVLGALLLDPEAIFKVDSRLHHTDFYDPTHKGIYKGIRELSDKGEAVDFVTVTEKLQGYDKLQRREQVPGLRRHRVRSGQPDQSRDPQTTQEHQSEIRPVFLLANVCCTHKQNLKGAVYDSTRNRVAGRIKGLPKERDLSAPHLL